MNENMEKDEHGQVKQYQNKTTELNTVQQEVYSQMGDVVIWPDALKRWKNLLRGAIATASDKEIVPGEPSGIIQDFMDGWDSILKDHGYSHLKTKKPIPEELHEDLFFYLDDWQTRLGMGFTQRKKRMDLSEPIRLKKLVDKEVYELILIYQDAAKTYHTWDTEEIRDRMEKQRNNELPGGRLLKQCTESFNTDDVDEMIEILKQLEVEQ